MGPTAAALLTEMADQLGRLSSLAHEVEGLKEENLVLRKNMELLAQVRGGRKWQRECKWERQWEC